MTLSRLALVLLAVAGFVAPLPAREADAVVQTTGAKAAPVGQLEQGEATPPTEKPSRQPRANLTLARREAGSRRYLLNRAWLL